jgi:hypothetical protein
VSLSLGLKLREGESEVDGPQRPARNDGQARAQRKHTKEKRNKLKMAMGVGECAAADAVVSTGNGESEAKKDSMLDCRWRMGRAGLCLSSDAGSVLADLLLVSLRRSFSFSPPRQKRLGLLIALARSLARFA